MGVFPRLCGCFGVSHADRYWVQMCSQHTPNLFVTSHSYTDDIQLYLSSDAADVISECLSKMEECVGEMEEWMMRNMLKLNDEKTEVLVISYFTDKIKETHPWFDV